MCTRSYTSVFAACAGDRSSRTVPPAVLPWPVVRDTADGGRPPGPPWRAAAGPRFPAWPTARRVGRGWPPQVRAEIEPSCALTTLIVRRGPAAPQPAANSGTAARCTDPNRSVVKASTSSVVPPVAEGRTAGGAAEGTGTRPGPAPRPALGEDSQLAWRAGQRNGRRGAAVPMSWTRHSVARRSSCRSAYQRPMAEPAGDRMAPGIAARRRRNAAALSAAAAKTTCALSRAGRAS
jgi:hypothetical protein